MVLSSQLYLITSYEELREKPFERDTYTGEQVDTQKAVL